MANFDSLEAKCPDNLQISIGLESFTAVLEGRSAFYLERMWEDGEWLYEFSVFLGRMPNFFRCNGGRIIVHHNVDYGGEYGFYAITFGLDEVQRDLIIGPGMNYGEWDKDFAEWVRHHRWPYWNLNPTIFRMPEETLTPIMRLSILENIITDNLRLRHGHVV